MALDAQIHPDITSDVLLDFGFHKVQRQTKTIIVDMIRNFLSSDSSLFRIDIPEVGALQSEASSTKPIVHVERDFPFFQRKFPLIVVGITGTSERKTYIGSDDMLYMDMIEDPPNTSTGKQTVVEVYAGMAIIGIECIIAAEDPNIRSRLSELLFICFSHYYRGHYIYYDEDGGMFNIVPATNGIDFGKEAEIASEDKTMVIYTNNVVFNCNIEYAFRSYIDPTKPYPISEFIINGNSGPISD